MADFEDLQKDIAEWGRLTFPDATLRSIHKHLMEEAAELAGICQAWLRCEEEGEYVWPSLMQEVADIIILACQIAERKGFTLDQVVQNKFMENLSRNWQLDPTKGYWRHVTDKD